MPRALHSNKRTAAAWTLALLALTGTPALAPAAQPAATAAPSSASPLRLSDDAGQELVLARPARRIVSVAPHLTELLFAAGAGERVVGADAWSDYPAAARQLPRVGDSTQLDLERIVALRPELIVVWADGTSARQLQRLQALKLPIYRSRMQRLEDVAATLRRLGTLAGTGAEAEAAARRYESGLQALRARYAGRRELRVFYQIWRRPLLTVNGRHFISQALQLCGARNVFGALDPLTPTVSEEAVVQADPDAIAASRQDSGGPDPLARWRGLDSLRATRQGALLLLDADTLHRPTDRLLQGTAELCRRLDEVRARMP
ncbi:cobalamin-binding protein [Azohydromonas caseinilytica]|uniref:Cobalamin-binding protein n=1 Tax=Azohydromonas caseinilytica TaxID=2728836 RepID=A0A848F837_9BURK|nr:cobalamin-binding protein [Azohydromonas caseinilytica]NML14926.1 cobalamin-binding protein [Azohydromonas caseinilytica]